MKTTVTLKLDACLLREARVIAAEEGRSISALLTVRLETMIRERKAFAPVRTGPSLGCTEGWTCSGRRLRRETNSMNDKTVGDLL